MRVARVPGGDRVRRVRSARCRGGTRARQLPTAERQAPAYLGLRGRLRSGSAAQQRLRDGVAAALRPQAAISRGGPRWMVRSEGGVAQDLAGPAGRARDFLRAIRSAAAVIRVSAAEKLSRGVAGAA